MISPLLRISVLVAFSPMLFQAQSGSAPALAGFPFTDENLNYSANWPSGLNLGEVHLGAKRSGSDWDFRFTVDAGIPGFMVRDIYTAQATSGLCSLSFDRSSTHGSRKTDETETIDRSRDIVTRVTKGGGGQSEFPVPDCLKDALTYLFYAREELGQGRVPPSQQILFGRLYQISLVYTGAPMIPVAGKQVQSDQMTATVKGPASSWTFDMYFARDPARTPLLVKIPFPLGTFSMELIR